MHSDALKRLIEAVEALPRWDPDYCDRMGSRSEMYEEPEGDYLARDAVLAILRAKLAEAESLNRHQTVD